MFHTVVQQGFQEVARSIIFILYIIYCCFQQWKNVQNWLTFDEVIAKIRQHVFFKDTVYCQQTAVIPFQRPWAFLFV